MALVPRLLGVALTASALAALALAQGTGMALADGVTPGNAGSLTSPVLLPPAAQASLLASDDPSYVGAQSQKSGLQAGHWDFFSVRPEGKSTDFTSLLGTAPSGAGLKFQLNW